MPLKAGQCEIIYACQKDEEYKTFFRNSLGEILQLSTGTQQWIKWKEEIEFCADITYYIITSLSGYQTLGEEYCSLVQVDNTARTVPASWQRKLMVVIQVMIPYLIRKLLRHLEQALQCCVSYSKMKNVILLLVPLFRQLINVIQRFHLTKFYFSSVYYDIAKRISGIQYVLTQGVTRNENYHYTYQVLGYITFLHFLLSLSKFIHQAIQTFSKVKEAVEANNESEVNSIPLKKMIKASKILKCTLCLEKLQDITATPCGHLFCWYCICQWCKNKPQCPLCREDLQTQQLVYLHHFHPS